jgi:hypothetical protein
LEPQQNRDLVCRSDAPPDKNGLKVKIGTAEGISKIRKVHGRSIPSWKISSSAVTSQSFLVLIDGSLLNFYLSLLREPFGR